MITIKDVAKAAGVSPSTVSIVLNGKCKERKISEETQQNIRKVMKEMGYVPNISAGKLREKTLTKTIALFWTLDYRDIMLARFLKGLQAEIAKKALDYKIVIYPYKNDELNKETSLESIADYHAAIIANASDTDMEYLRGLDPLIPIVLYNRNVDHLGSVYIDDAEIAQTAFGLLKDYKNVTMIDVPHAFAGMRIREQKLAGLLGGNLLATVKADTNTAEGGYNACSNIDLSKTDVIYTPSDMIALGVLNYASKNNINIPKDVKLLSIGNGLTQMDAYVGPGLTTIDIPLEDMAGKCLELVTDELGGGSVRKEKVSPKVSIRGTL